MEVSEAVDRICGPCPVSRSEFDENCPYDYEEVCDGCIVRAIADMAAESWRADTGRLAELHRSMIEIGHKRTGGAVKEYRFFAKDMTEVEVRIVGEWADGSKDVTVSAGKYYREWDELDGGQVDEVFTDLIKHGLEFQSRNLYIHLHVVASVMIDGDDTYSSIAGRAAGMTQEELESWFECFVSED